MNATRAHAALKVCDLCGAINLAGNAECFSCGWHGRFETRAEIVRLARELYERRHGRLDPDELRARSRTHAKRDDATPYALYASVLLFGAMVLLCVVCYAR